MALFSADPAASRLARPVGSLRPIAVVAQDRCTGCGMCVAACAAGAIAVDELARIDPARCVGCGACIPECPNEALTLTVNAPSAAHRVERNTR